MAGPVSVGQHPSGISELLIERSRDPPSGYHSFNLIRSQEEMASKKSSVNVADIRGYFEARVRVASADGKYLTAFCPFHDDRKTPNLKIDKSSGQFNCFACKSHGKDPIEFHRLIMGLATRLEAIESMKQEGVDLVGLDEEGKESVKPRGVPDALVNDAHRLLMNTKQWVEWLKDHRGLSRKLLKLYKIGFREGRVWIPIPSSPGAGYEFSWRNVRKYKPKAKTTDSKMINHPDCGTPTIYPPVQKGKETLLLVEGEMDCLLARQIGFHAHTITGGANTWAAGWPEEEIAPFEGREVIICYDIDLTGIICADAHARTLFMKAETVKVIRLPMSVKEHPHGDLTDWIVKLGHTAKDLQKLISEAEDYQPIRPRRVIDDQVLIVPLAQASNASCHYRRVQMEGLVAGKDLSPYIVPQTVRFSCNQVGRHQICGLCGLARADRMGLPEDQWTPGIAVLKFGADTPEVLKFVDVQDERKGKVLQASVPIPSNCKRWDHEELETQNLTRILLTPEVDARKAVEGDEEYVFREGYILRENPSANMSYRFEGVTIPFPKDQRSCHLLDGAHAARDEISSFVMTPELLRAFRRAFQPKAKQSIKDKFDEIHEDLENNVTRIWHRRDIMTAFDLVWHSVIQFDFAGQRLVRGWTEAFVLGDTRTGKTETASRMIYHYRAGDFVKCENVSYAGIVGGMSKVGEHWSVTWGKAVLNDRRALCLDEVSSLPEGLIPDLSGMRSSGVAEITKIHAAKTRARTRFFWMSNTAKGKSLRTYALPVLALPEIMTHNEDLARLDLALVAMSDDVPLKEIHDREKIPIQEPKFSSDLCRALVLWAWSRKADQIVFSKRAVDRIRKVSEEMSETYSSNLPLVEGMEQRIKLARLSVAVAARTFSSDESGEKILIQPEHVDFVREFLHKIYCHMRYDVYSLQVRAENEIKEPQAVRKKLMDNSLEPSWERLCEMIKSYSEIGPSDIQQIFGMDPGPARDLLNFLFRRRALILSKPGRFTLSSGFLSLLNGNGPPEPESPIKKKRRRRKGGSVS